MFPASPVNFCFVLGFFWSDFKNHYVWPRALFYKLSNVKSQEEFQNVYGPLPRKVLFSRVTSVRKGKSFFLGNYDFAFLKKLIDSDTFAY